MKEPHVVVEFPVELALNNVLAGPTTHRAEAVSSGAVRLFLRGRRRPLAGQWRSAGRPQAKFISASLPFSTTETRQSSACVGRPPVSQLNEASSPLGAGGAHRPAKGFVWQARAQTKAAAMESADEFGRAACMWTRSARAKYFAWRHSLRDSECSSGLVSIDFAPKIDYFFELYLVHKLILNRHLH
jgi:hypothetical protein